MGVSEVRLDSGPKGQEWRELQYVLSVWTYALSGFRVLEPSRENPNQLSVCCSLESSVVPIDRPSFGESASPFIDEGDGFIRERVWEKESVCAT